MKNLLMIAVLGSMMWGCVTNPHKVKELDNKVENMESVGSGVVIGLKNDEMIAQSQVLLSEEMRVAQNTAYELEKRVYGGHRYYDNRGLYGVLRDCQKQLSAGTNGLDPMVEERDYVIPEDEYEVGSINGKLSGIHREYLKDRLARFRQYRDVLRKRESEYEKKIDLCEIKNQSKREVAGE